MHVVQIWIMHTNALKTQLMHKNVQTNPKKSQKLTQHSCCSMLAREKILKAIRGNGYHFVPKGGTFHTENHHACCEKLRFVRSIYPNMPQMGQICTTACWWRSMIAYQVSLISGEFSIYRNLKTKFLNVLGRVTTPRCLNFIPISCMGPRNLPMDTYLNFQIFYMH